MLLGPEERARDPLQREVAADDGRGLADAADAGAGRRLLLHPLLALLADHVTHLWTKYFYVDTYIF